MSETVRINIVIPADLLERFREVAKANERSVSGHIRFLMAQALVVPVVSAGTDQP